MHPLKMARLGRGWSQSRLLLELEVQANRLGHQLPGRSSLKTELSRWENGHRSPDHLYRRLFRLIYNLNDGELGFKHKDDDLALGAPRSWQQSIEHASALWDADMNRRDLLATAGFSTAAFLTPALHVLVSHTADEPERVTGAQAVQAVDVEAIRQMTTSLRGLDNRFGGGQVRTTAVAFLNTQVAPLLRTNDFTAQHGRRLFQAAAEMTQLVGWMSHDVGAHALAQRYLIQALGLAQAAGDLALTAELLAAMSQQSTYLNETATSIDLARSAAAMAQRAGVPALAAEAAVMEAHGHARAGDSAACATALHAAEIALDRADRTSDPNWIGYFDEAYLSAKFGHCFRELGDTENAIKAAERSLDMDNSYRRGRAFNLALLAHSHAQASRVEEACHYGQEAITLVKDLRSHRAIRYLRDVRDALPADRQSAAVRGFDDDLAPVLAA